MIGKVCFFTEITLVNRRPTKRAPDVWDSAAFSSIFLASGFSCSQAESTPAHTQVTQTVGRLHVGIMKKYRMIFRLLIVSVFLASCARSQATEDVENNNFPLQQKWAVSTGDDIYNLAISQGWIVIGTPFKLIAVDPATGFSLWEKDLHLNTDSPLLIKDQMVIAADSKKIELIERNGNELASIQLETQEGSAELLAWAADYLFVIRRQTWILEVYDVKKLELIWSIYIDRGGIRVHFDETTGIAYITTLSDIRAINPSTGEIYWTIPKTVIASFYDSGILYFAESIDNESGVRFVAYNVTSKSEEWESERFYQNLVSVNALTTSSEYIIISTQTGLIALDKHNGEPRWKSERTDDYFVSPVQLGDIFYVKAPMERTVFAVSPDKRSVGYLKYGKPVVFSQSYNEYHSGIYTTMNLVIFSSNNMVYAYGK